MKDKNAVVIGAGAAGLATACFLAREGWKVQVFEKNKTIGGRARVLKTKGFTFDMGPSWYLMPEVFDKFFEKFGKKSSDYYQLKMLDPRYHIYFEDGTKVTLKKDLEDNKKVFDKLEPGAGKKLDAYLLSSRGRYEAATESLIYEDLGDWKTYLKFQNIPSILKMMGGINPLGSWGSETSKYFSHPKLLQILDFPAVFLGGSPSNIPSVFTLQSWSEYGMQVWYPKGGMFSVIKALSDLAGELGVTIKSGSEVDKVEIDDGGEVFGVRVKGKHIPTRVVVNGGDYVWGETKMIDKKWQVYPEKYWSNKVMGISAVLLFLGINKKFPKLAHHNLFLANDWQVHFDQIFKSPTWPSEPNFYVSARSVTDPTLAPKNCEELYVLIPVATGLKWDKKHLESLIKKVFDRMETALGENLSKHLLVSQTYFGDDFEKDYRAYQGTALGLAHTLNQSVIFRPRNKNVKVRGLYYAGQYTNPGIGLPLALISAEVTSSLVKNDYGGNNQ